MIALAQSPTPGPSLAELQARFERAKAEFERAAAEYNDASEGVRSFLRAEMQKLPPARGVKPRLRIMGNEIQQIVEVVAEHYHVRPADIFGRSQAARLVCPRHNAMALARRFYPAFTLVEIGCAFNRDHGTVIWALKSVEARSANEPAFARDVEQLEAKCEARLGTLIQP